MGTAYTSAKTGNWSDSTAWTPAGVPGPGDTAKVVSPHTMTVDSAVTVGNSPPGAPTTALTVNVTGGGSTGGSLVAGTYVPVYTQVDTNGAESAPCGVISGSFTVASGNVPRVTFPALPSGIASYNLYLSNSGGNGPFYQYATGITTTTSDCSAALNTGNPKSTAIANGVIVASGGTLAIGTNSLAIRGNLGMEGAITGGAGGSLTFDGSLSLQNGTYQWQTQWTAGTGSITLTGTSVSHFTVQSNAGGPNAYTSMVVGNGGGGTVAHNLTYVDFIRFGSSTSKQALIFNRQSSGSAVQTLSHVTFDAKSGTVDTNTTMQVVDGYSIANCSFDQTVTPLRLIVSGTANGGVTRTLNDCEFNLAAPTLYLGSMSSARVYFGNGYTPNLAGGQTSITDWFVRQTGTVGGVNLYGSMTGVHLVCDTAANNPHFSTPSTTGTLDTFVAEYTSTDTQGDVFASAGQSITTTIQNTLILPNAAGLPSGSFTNFGNSGVTQAVNLYHNTYATGTSSDGIIYNDYSTPNAGLYTNIKSNLAYLPSGGSTAGYRLKCDSVINHSNPATGTQDIVNGANCTNNAMGQFDAGLAGKGYNAYCSVAPGTNDVDLSATGPQFVDWTRNFATYDSAASGLNNSAATWVTAHSYNVGDFVSAQSTGYYGNAVINYRCIKAHTSNAGDATNGQPGSSTATGWRTNWEFATAYRLRADTTKIPTLRNWIKAGFAVQNAALNNAGHDGVTIGAGAYQAAGGPFPHFLRRSLHGGMLTMAGGLN